MLSCFICGHVSLIKYSDKDKVLLTWLIEKLVEFNDKAAEYFVSIDRLKEYDAAIATGSNTSAVEFEYYFRSVPHIIRRNRNSIAVLDGSESLEDMIKLGKDIFTYFGLGCRNVSQIYVPADYDIKRLFTYFDSFDSIKFHHKYKNNYDYNLAVMLLNNESFLHNEFLILKESDQIVSRISCLHYQYYKDLQSATDIIESKKDQLQCVVTNMPLGKIQTVKLGDAQLPAIDDYADSVDTIQFLLSI